MNQVNIGDTLTCAETGKLFVAAIDGSTTNYATNSKGEVFSDEGVHIIDKRELLDRTKPFTCYISSDGKHATGWKGNVLGYITESHSTPLPFGHKFYHWHGKNYTAYTVRDIHGGLWYGKSSPGMCINLRPKK